MPLFEPHTQQLLLEITAKPRRKRTKSRLVSSGGGGGYGGGFPSGKPGTTVGIWTGTPPAPGTVMPSGSGILGQGIWGQVSQMADPALDHYLSFIPDPLLKFGAKQLAKTGLANQYLRGLGSSSATTAMDIISGGFKSGGTGAAPAYTAGSSSPFGILGDKVADKLGGLAAMGIDPLDWATKAFGAQSALSHMANIGSQTASAAVGAGGYLERGKRKGIF